MTEAEKYQIAKRYVDKQIETMKQANSAPKDLSSDKYDELIRCIANTIQNRTKDRIDSIRTR